MGMPLNAMMMPLGNYYPNYNNSTPNNQPNSKVNQSQEMNLNLQSPNQQIGINQQWASNLANRGMPFENF